MNGPVVVFSNDLAPVTVMPPNAPVIAAIVEPTTPVTLSVSPWSITVGPVGEAASTN